MGKIIAVANQKGGVAKTTSTFNIAAVLAGKGKKVLMIDFDSQASLTISAGLEPRDYENNIVTILSNKSKKDVIQDCIVPLEKIPNLFLITSIIDLARVELELQGRTARERVLSRALEPICNDYDFIFIDCPPQLSVLTLNALAASDYVLVPCKTDYLSYRGLEQLEETIEDVRDCLNSKIKMLGVIATFYEKASSDDNDILRGLKEKYNVIGVVKKSVEVKKGIYDGIPIVLSKSKTDISKEMSKEYESIANDYLLKAE